MREEGQGYRMELKGMKGLFSAEQPVGSRRCEIRLGGIFSAEMGKGTVRSK